MSDNSGDGTVKPSTAPSGVTEEQLQQMIQKTVMGIFKEAVPRMIQKSLTEGDFFGKAVESQLEKMVVTGGDDSAAPTAVGNDAGDGKVTMKSLQAQLESMNKAIAAEREARTRAESATRDARHRAEVQQKLSAKLGADNPAVGLLMDSLFDVKKQFVEHEGRLAVKFNDQGFDDYKALDEGIDALFAGPYKHFVQSSKAGQLPPVGGARQFGQPIRQGNGQQAQQQHPARNNPLMAIAEGIAEQRPEAAQILAEDASKLAAPLPRK